MQQHSKVLALGSEQVALDSRLLASSAQLHCALLHDCLERSAAALVSTTPLHHDLGMW